MDNQTLIIGLILLVLHTLTIYFLFMQPAVRNLLAALFCKINQPIVSPSTGLCVNCQKSHDPKTGERFDG
jgi:hypothetical protein